MDSICMYVVLWNPINVLFIIVHSWEFLFSFLSFSLLIFTFCFIFLSYNWQNCKIFKMSNVMIWYRYTLEKDFLPLSSLIYLSPHLRWLCFCLVRTFKFHSLRKFQFYSTVLSTILIILNIRSSDYLHILNR